MVPPPPLHVCGHQRASSGGGEQKLSSPWAQVMVRGAEGERWASSTSSSSSSSSSSSPSSSHSGAHKDALAMPLPNNNNNNNNGAHHRQRSMKRGGGYRTGRGHSLSGFSNPPSLPPPFPVVPIPPSGYGNAVPGIPYRNSGWGTSSTLPPPPLGGYVPPPPPMNGQWYPPPAFYAPPPYANPMAFPEYYCPPTLPLDPFMGMPFINHGPPPAMPLPVAEPPPIEPPLTSKIMNQIDYYFSDTNLKTDEYLKARMDGQGWVSVDLIAGFNRVKYLTNDIQLILDSMRNSTIVEVKGDKLRRRYEWMKWIPLILLGANSGSSSQVGTSSNDLATDFQKIALVEAVADEGNSKALEDRSPTDFSSQPQLPNGDTTRITNETQF